MVEAEAGMRIHVVVMQQEAHMEEVLPSRRGLDGSSSYGYRCFHMGHWLVTCIGPQHWHAQPSYPLLKEQLGSSLLGAQ